MVESSVFQSCKTRKRKTMASPESCEVIDLPGPFRKNIRWFLNEFGDLQDYTIDGKPVWRTLFLTANFPLYIVEETVEESSPSFCDQCRYVGWGHHFVSKRRYHLIILADGACNKSLKTGALELYTHLLHSVIHCNGFGHILCINGINEGPHRLSSDVIMKFFDGICITLRTRQITVRDFSIKGSMELRLLHTLAYGKPFFGNWGYKFCNGSFGITEKKYKRSIEILSSLELDKIMDDFSDQDDEAVKIISTYRDASDVPLVTIGDLLNYMLAFNKCKAPIQKKTIMASDTISSKNQLNETAHQQKISREQYQTNYDRFVTTITKLESRWPAVRLKYVAEVIVDALRENKKASKNGKKGMLRQELRDAVRSNIGDTGLIDFVLKSMGKLAGGNQIICRRKRPVSGLIEFSLQDIDNEGDLKMEVKTESPQPLPSEPERDVYQDTVYMYKRVLLGYPESSPVGLATKVILDSKQFMKEWEFSEKSGEDNESTRLICRVLPCYDDLVSELTQPLPPGEPIVVPPRTTVGEFKLLAQCALRDTYFIMDQFTVKQIGGFKGSDDEDVLAWTEGSGNEVWVRGCGLDLDTELRYEGGPSDWKVDCVCGAKDDDGERMVACDVCHKWQHTRCSNIAEDDDQPAQFLCSDCSLK